MSEAGLKVGDIVAGEVKKILPFGAVIALPGNRNGLIHISQVAETFVENIAEHLSIGAVVTARVKKIAANGSIDLTLKPAASFPAAIGRMNKEYRHGGLAEQLERLLAQGKTRYDDEQR